LAKRVFEIAKELGVKSKAVVEKCRAEGIPETAIKNHMSTVSVGLEASIRDWFSGGEAASATAVETADKVDVEKVRAAQPRRAKAKAKTSSESETSESESDTATAVAEPPARKEGEDRASGEGEGEPEDGERRDEAAAAAGPDRPAREAGTARAGAKELEPEAGAAETDEAPAEEAERGSRPATEEPGIAASAPETRGDGGRGETREGGGEPRSREAARQNVPDRPKVVKPAGEKLEVQSPVTLRGPKVVRVEAPEPVSEMPRPRRGAGAGAPPPVEPPGTGPRRRGPGGGEDDRPRSPRRGKGGGGRTGTRRKDGGGTGGAPEWRTQDLIERQQRLRRSGGFLKKRRQEAKRKAAGGARPTPAEKPSGPVKIEAPFTIKDLSAATGVRAADILKKLVMQGVMTNINAGISAEKAQEVMLDFDIELEVVEAQTAEEAVSKEFEKRDAVDERPRGPVVTILGHVDHGKTSLLDRIRNANVAEGEAGGITQATSAFRVPVRVGEEEKVVVFIDTPGHEAFTAMRSRGADTTDIVVLVVAADDGVMPQTVESINHAKAAGKPVIVALNKIDRPDATDANIQKILGQLAEHELNPVEWGGDTEVVRTSAATGEGIQELLETLDYQSQLLELTADFGGPAVGSVLESRLEEGLGPVANVLIQEGVLHVGDFIVAGRAFGRVRDITDDRGNRVKESVPPSPVRISGLDEVPDAGDRFYIVDSLKKAEQAAEQRRHRERETQLAQPKVTLDSIFDQMSEEDLKEILVVLKADVQGSVDAIKGEVEKVSGEDVRVRVLHAAVGGITESDVLLAEASKAVIIGFNVIATGKARSVADRKGVEIRNYQVIYDITDDLKKAAEGLLEPELRQEVLGHAEVRAVFKVSKVGAVAGCYVTDGTVQRDALIRVTRDGIVIENDRVLEQLKRFKDDVKEVRSGMECGMKIDSYDDIKEGDVLECYRNVEVKRTL